MSVMIEMVPQTRLVGDIADPAYVQPLETVVDLSEFTDIAVMVTISEFDYVSDTLEVFLATAMENRDERYVRLAKLFDLSADKSDFKYFGYFTGPGDSNSDTPATDTPGFGRYLRIEVDGMNAASQELIFDVQALARAR